MTRELFLLIGALAFLLFGLILVFSGHRVTTFCERYDDMGTSLMIAGTMIVFIGMLFTIASYVNMSDTFPSSAKIQVNQTEKSQPEKSE